MKIIRKFPICLVQEILNSFDLDIYKIRKYEDSKLFLKHEILDYNLNIDVPKIIFDSSEVNFDNLDLLRVAEVRGKPNLVLFDYAGIKAYVPGFSKDYYLSGPVPFLLEKEFRATRGQNRIDGWKNAIPLEESINSTILAVNAHPQLYTSGWCHSGVLSEVKGYENLAKEGFFVFKMDEEKKSVKQLMADLQKEIPNLEIHELKGLKPIGPISYVAIKDENSKFENYVCRIISQDEQTTVSSWEKVSRLIKNNYDSAKKEEHNLFNHKFKIVRS